MLNIFTAYSLFAVSKSYNSLSNFSAHTITLSYTFNDQEYEVNDGDDLHFTIPEKSIEKTNGLEPLWPYKYININDTKFVKNGAFGSNAPWLPGNREMQGYKSRAIRRYNAETHAIKNRNNYNVNLN